MSSILNKLADHPHASSDPDVNPNRGVDGAPAAVRDDNDASRSQPQNWIEKGQGGERKFGDDEYQVQAGNASAADTTVPAQLSMNSSESGRESGDGFRR